MNAPFAPSQPTARVVFVAIWLVCAAAMIVGRWEMIAAFTFSDPDDALRLVQVRDLLAGQSWFDLTQYRIHPPDGVPMHWSRLVDLPLALTLATLRPLLGTGLAERVTLVIVPLAQLLLLMALVYKLSRKLGLGTGTALLAVALLSTSVSILFQFAPMRIDHHGAQVVLGALAVLALTGTGRRDGRMGLLAGVAMAAWLQISIEGLPCAVAMGAVFALRHMQRVDCWPDLRSYLLALTVGSAVLLFGTRAPMAALAPWCDSMSPAYLVPLAIACAGVLIGGLSMQRNSLSGRTAPLILGGVAGTAAFLLLSRQCLAGPFETLDPLVYQSWYMAVKEGMPITAQTADMQALIVLPALLGLVGSLFGLRGARGPERCRAWTGLILMQVAAFAVSLDVMRAMSFAHLLALPGNAVLLARLLAGAQRLRAMPLRVGLSAGAAVFTPLGATAAMAAAFAQPQAARPADAATAETARHGCVTATGLRGLGALPPALLFAPLDISSHMLAHTHHSVIGTGHHRNVAGMKTVISALLAPPDAARAMVATSGARYLVFCADDNEARKYARQQPESLIGQLLRGQTPDWLAPVPMRPGETIHVLRVVPPTA
ncbi:MAG TPA: hypothetical protein VFF89_09935 [Sphingobium sp.]|nr:hypothetical protein [Sphingobium sp.]